MSLACHWTQHDVLDAMDRRSEAWYHEDRIWLIEDSNSSYTFSLLLRPHGRKKESIAHDSRGVNSQLRRLLICKFHSVRPRHSKFPLSLFPLLDQIYKLLPLWFGGSLLLSISVINATIFLLLPIRAFSNPLFFDGVSDNVSYQCLIHLVQIDAR